MGRYYYQKHTHFYHDAEMVCREVEVEVPAQAEEVRIERVGDYTIVGYLQPDDDPMDFWDGDGLGTLVEFTSQSQAESELNRVMYQKGTMWLLVQKYSHSGVHYSIAGHHSYPDFMWDVSPFAGIFIPCDWVQKQYHKNKYKRGGKAAALAKMQADSNSILDEYSKWCNGDVWGYVVEVRDQDGEELTDEADSCWGFIGYEYATEELERAFKYAVEKYIVETAEVA
jgi:hypothetical protein